MMALGCAKGASRGGCTRAPGGRTPTKFVRWCLAGQQTATRQGRNVKGKAQVWRGIHRTRHLWPGNKRWMKRDMGLVVHREVDRRRKPVNSWDLGRYRAPFGNEPSLPARMHPGARMTMSPHPRSPHSEGIETSPSHTTFISGPHEPTVQPETLINRDNKHCWFSGKILRCHRGALGSIPRQCNPQCGRESLIFCSLVAA